MTKRVTTKLLPGLEYDSPGPATVDRVFDTISISQEATIRRVAAPGDMYWRSNHAGTQYFMTLGVTAEDGMRIEITEALFTRLAGLWQ